MAENWFGFGSDGGGDIRAVALADRQKSHSNIMFMFRSRGSFLPQTEYNTPDMHISHIELCWGRKKMSISITGASQNRSALITISQLYLIYMCV